MSVYNSGYTGTNLCPFDAVNWVTDYPYGTTTPALNCYHDTTTTYSGYYTYRVDPTNPNRGLDYNPSISLNVGDHIVILCWIQTGSGTESGGAKLGMDLYGSLGGISPIYSTQVPWGSGWTLCTWDFIVQPTYLYVYGSTGQTGMYSTGQYVTPTYCIPYCNVTCNDYPTGGGQAWFSGFYFMKNPSTVGGGSTPTLAQSKRGESVSSTTISLTMTSAPTSGNRIKGYIGIRDNSQLSHVNSITQTNVAWTLKQASSLYGGGNVRVEEWEGVVSASAVQAATVTLSSSCQNAIADFLEFSNLSATIDKVATTQNGAGSTTGATGTTATTTQASQLIIGAVMTQDAQSAPLAGFTGLDGANNNGWGSLYVMYQAVNATGAWQATDTIASNNPYVGLITAQNSNAAATCTLTIIAGNGGTVTPAAGTTTPAGGTQITVTATANGGYIFGYFLVNGAHQAANPYIFYINAATTIQPVFILTPNTVKYNIANNILTITVNLANQTVNLSL